MATRYVGSSPGLLASTIEVSRPFYGMPASCATRGFQNRSSARKAGSIASKSHPPLSRDLCEGQSSKGPFMEGKYRDV